jgi:arylsulfatase
MKPGKDGWPGQYRTENIDSIELYDLRRDPGEWYDVSDIYPEKVKELEVLVQEARLDLGDENTGAPGANRRKAGIIK